MDMVWATMDMDIDMAMEDMDIGEEKRGPLMLNLSQLLMLRLMPILGIPMDMVLDTMVDTEVMDIQHTGHTMEDMEDMDIGEERRDPLTLNLSQLLMLMLNLGTLPMDMVLDTLMVDMADGVDMVDTVDMADTVVGTTMESNSIMY